MMCERCGLITRSQNPEAIKDSICPICNIFKKKEEFNPISNHTQLDEKECIELLNLLYDNIYILGVAKKDFIEKGKNIMYNNAWMYKG